MPKTVDLPPRALSSLSIDREWQEVDIWQRGQLLVQLITTFASDLVR